MSTPTLRYDPGRRGIEITGDDGVTLDFSNEVHVLVSPAVANHVRGVDVARRFALEAIAEGKPTSKLVLSDDRFKQMLGA
ncbi:MAG: hypothetical protein ACLPT4_14070 [Verrucomicrobiia bacterium]